jgi:hypothetical protein
VVWSGQRAAASGGRTRGRRPTRAITLFLLAIAVQAALVAATVFVVVLVPAEREEPDFGAARTIVLPQRQLEHQQAVAAFEQAARSPLQMEKVSLDEVTPEALPEVPPLPSMDLSPATPPAANPAATALFGAADLGSALGNLGGEASSVSLLGVEDRAERILIVFDISQSVVRAMAAAGQPIERIREETLALIEGLNANTLFGLLQHSRQYELFRDYLLPATVANKAAARRWMRTEFETGGALSGQKYEGEDGAAAVLEAAFDLRPQVIFLLSDGSYQRTPPGGGQETIPWEELEERVRVRQEELAEPARLHTIGFAVDERDRSGFRRLARHNGGRTEFHDE